MKLARSKIFLVLGILAAWLLMTYQKQLHIEDYAENMLMLIGINTIMAVSLNLVNGYTGQFSLGHAGFMAVGAYASAMFTKVLGPKILPPEAMEKHYWEVAILFLSSLLAGGLCAALAGLCVGVPSLRLKGDYLAIVTLGFGEIIRVMLLNMDVVGGATGLNGIGKYTNLFWTYTLVCITVYVIVSLVNSTYGRGFLAVRDDEIAAEAMGINTTKFKVIAFVIAAGFAGVAGGLFAHYIQFISPDGFNFMLSVSIVVMVILGGMGSTPGVVLAAILLTLLPEGLRWFAKSPVLDGIIHFTFHSLSPESFTTASKKTKAFFENRMIFYSLLLISFMLLRPQGLFGDVNAARRADPNRPRKKG